MPQILKPTNLSLTWASGGDVLNPGDIKYATGWQVEIPPRQWFNYLDNRQDTALAHINQHGVVTWDEDTEYQAGKSYVQGVATGAVYRCKVTHVNEDPELDVGEVYWGFAFASPRDFYTKVEAGAAFLAKSANGSDIPNAATFRTNVNVYSKAETYTKAEVDNKTTVASTLQSQYLTSNTVLLTPLRLAEAFQAANQSLSPNGYQKIPGGFIIQWGSTAASIHAGDNVTSTPIPFPNQFLEVLLTQDYTPGTGVISYAGSVPTSNSQFTWRGSVPGQGFSFIAIGR